MNNTTENTPLLNIPQLAEMLQIKESLIRKMIFYREIEFIKVGRLIRFDLKDVQEWINNRKQNRNDLQEA